jgi:hypothetical protein
MGKFQLTSIWRIIRLSFGRIIKESRQKRKDKIMVKPKNKNRGEPKSYDDICEVFLGYLEGKVKYLPWCEKSIDLETNMISEKLKKINKNGFLTINSQPKVNGAKSNDKVVGWGGEGGYVRIIINEKGLSKSIHRILLHTKSFKKAQKDNFQIPIINISRD